MLEKKIKISLESFDLETTTIIPDNNSQIREDCSENYYYYATISMNNESDGYFAKKNVGIIDDIFSSTSLIEQRVDIQLFQTDGTSENITVGLFNKDRIANGYSAWHITTLCGKEMRKFYMPERLLEKNKKDDKQVDLNRAALLTMCYIIGRSVVNDSTEIAFREIRELKEGKLVKINQFN